MGAGRPPQPFQDKGSRYPVIDQLEADFFRGKEPNAVVANREGQEAANARLIRCASTLQCALEAKGWLDHSLEADAHHITEILCTAVPCLQRQWGDGDSRSQQSNGELAKHGLGVTSRMMLGFA